MPTVKDAAKRLLFSHDEGELFIDSESNYWHVDNKYRYQLVEKYLNIQIVKRANYTVNARYDISGFDYWDNENDDNYFVITITFKKDTVTNRDINTARKDVDNMISNILSFIEKQNNSHA